MSQTVVSEQATSRNIWRVFDVLPHCPDEDRDEDWFQAGNNYPVYQKIGEVLHPTTIIEIGTRLGYSLLSLLDGADDVRDIVIIDNESYVLHSNVKAIQNVGAYRRKFRPEWEMPKVRAFHSRTDARNQMPELFADGENERLLIHIDGDHSFDGCLADLRSMFQWCPDVILVDDYDFIADVRNAVAVFVAETGLPMGSIATFRGLAVIDNANVWDGHPGALGLLRRSGIDVRDF